MRSFGSPIGGVLATLVHKAKVAQKEESISFVEIKSKVRKKEKESTGVNGYFPSYYP